MTDHRTEAEDWLESATDRLGDPLATDVLTTIRELALIEALIGIGHALLANLGSNRPYDFDASGALHIMGAAGHHFEDDDPEQP